MSLRNRFSVVNIDRRILILNFKSCVEMNQTLVRFTEFREGGDHSIKIIDKGAIWDKYLFQQNPFDFMEETGGHNIWANLIVEMEQKGVVWDADEQLIVNLMRAELDLRYPCMLIAVHDWDTETLLHELFHAAWYIVPDYRDKVREIMKLATRTDRRQMMKELTDEMHYSVDILEDEMHAYLGENYKWGFLKGGKQRSRFTKIHKKLVELLNITFGFHFPIALLSKHLQEIQDVE